MKKGLIVLIISLLAICAGILYIKKKGNIERTNEKCCETCKEGEDMYSLLREGNCGIFCFKPEEFETRVEHVPNITKIDDQDCFKLGYTVYDSTITEGSGKYKLNIDIYKKP